MPVSELHELLRLGLLGIVTAQETRRHAEQIGSSVTFTDSLALSASAGELGQPQLPAACAARGLCAEARAIDNSGSGRETRRGRS